MKLTKINDIKVKPFKKPVLIMKDVITEPYFGNILYPNVFICSKKNSGKTVLIGNLLKNCSNSRTTVIIFSSTINKDDTWKEILKALEKKKITVLTYSSINEENGLDELIDLMSVPEHVDDEGEKIELIKVDGTDKERPPRKLKKQAPEYIIVYDDLANEIADKRISFLLTKNRHFKAINIVSSQYYNHLAKQARTQLDFIILFGNIPDDKLKIIHQESDLSVDFEDFEKMYKFATSGKFNFFYANLRNETFRKNFNELISI